MKAVVVYESYWGNTAAVARAIAAGLGPDTPVLPTGTASPEAIAGADLIVAGSPVIGFHMPSDKMRDSIKVKPGAPNAPDLSQPSMASWLQGLPKGQGAAAAFDTRIRGPFGSAAPAILKGLEAAGYRGIAKPRGFVVTGTFGPLRAGELDRAREWGAELAQSLG
jgi:flavodoxin